MAIKVELHCQKASYFFDFGINHSGLESKLPPYPSVNTYKNFNPNVFIAFGTEIKLRKRLSFIPSIGWRITGSKYIDSIKSSTLPHKVIRTESIYTRIQQFNIPILIGYSVGKKKNLIPLIGINNNLNYLIYQKSESHGYKKLGNGYLYTYVPYGLVGLVFEKRKLFHEKIGLAIKCTYEQNLRNLRKENYDILILNQRILSFSLQINYCLK